METNNNVPKLKLSNYTEDFIILTYSIIVDVIVIITLIATPFYYLLIIKKSTKKMKNYQIFLIFYTTFTLVITLLFGVAKPAKILPLSTHFSMGLWKNLPKIPMIISYILGNISPGIATDFLLLALVQRYFNVSKIVAKNTEFYKQFWYFVIISTCLFGNIMSQIEAIGCLLPESELQNYFYARIDNSPQFLSTRQYVIVASCTQTSPSWINIVLGCLWLSRPLAFGIILYKNLTFTRKYSAQIGPITTKMHKMLVKAVITQIVACVICTRLPPIILIALMFTGNLAWLTAATYFNYLALCALPLMDMIITVYFVTPYRRYISKFVSTVNAANSNNSIDLNTVYPNENHPTSTAPPKIT